jgi:hypothetical protein
MGTVSLDVRDAQKAIVLHPSAPSSFEEGAVFKD